MDKKFAILGDIHANLDALNAVLDDARHEGVTDFVSVGDVVGYNAEPAACIRIVRDELNCPTVRGNHDHYVSSDAPLADFQPLAASVVEWTRRQLSDADLDWLRNLPFKRLVVGFTLVHATLDMPDHWGYVFDLLSAEANFTYQRTPICFHGHTHVPMIYEKLGPVTRSDPHDFTVKLGQRLFINVGSVGQPRDGDPRASYVIYEPKTHAIHFRRLAYDVEAAMARNRKAGLPERLATRLAQGR